MSGNLLLVILVYATIPVYVVGLLALVAFLARYQLQVSPSQELKRLLKSSLQKGRGKRQYAYPPVVYVSFLALSTFLVVMAIILGKGKRS